MWKINNIKEHTKTIQYTDNRQVSDQVENKTDEENQFPTEIPKGTIAY